MKEASHKFPKSGRVKNFGYFQSNDGLVEGRGEEGAEFVKNYEAIQKNDRELRNDWIKALLSIGVKAAHPDDGYHHRDKNDMYFTLAYPYFDYGIETGDMVALGDYDKFVVVIVSKKRGIFSTHYEYKTTIY